MARQEELSTREMNRFHHKKKEKKGSLRLEKSGTS
jgi:hypothetical protein